MTGNIQQQVNVTETTQTSECTVCGFVIEFPSDTEIWELIECQDCGTEFEVISISPIEIEEAPMTEEDWGE